MGEDDTIDSIPGLKKRAKAGDAHAVEVLIAYTSWPDVRAAVDATKALGAVGGERVIDALAKITSENRDHKVGNAAAEALDRAAKSDGYARAALVIACEQPTVNAAAIAALVACVDRGELHDDPRVLAIIRRAVTEGDAQARKHALGALGALTTAKPAAARPSGRKKRPTAKGSTPPKSKKRR